MFCIKAYDLINFLTTLPTIKIATASIKYQNPSNIISLVKSDPKFKKMPIAIKITQTKL